MAYLFKCVHCDFIDYRDGEPQGCPDCGSKVTKLDSPFKGDKITYKVMNMRSQWTDTEITFEKAERFCDSIIDKSLNEAIPDEYIRRRVIFMIKAYAWMLLKKYPQMWADMTLLVSGMTQILTLKVMGPKGKRQTE
jgi:hypothetical protein